MTTRTDQTPVEYFSQVTHYVASEESNNPAVQDVATIVQASTSTVQVNSLTPLEVVSQRLTSTLLRHLKYDSVKKKIPEKALTLVVNA